MLTSGKRKSILNENRVLKSRIKGLKRKLVMENLDGYQLKTKLETMFGEVVDARKSYPNIDDYNNMLGTEYDDDLINDFWCYVEYGDDEHLVSIKYIENEGYDVLGSFPNIGKQFFDVNEDNKLIEFVKSQIAKYNNSTKY